MADILNQIDATLDAHDKIKSSIEENERRFHLTAAGEVEYGNTANGMRWRPHGQDGIEEEAVPVAAVVELPALWVQSDTSPWVSFAEASGSAPTDRVADAFRAEVARQGLSSYSIDGVPGRIEGDVDWAGLGADMDVPVVIFDEPSGNGMFFTREQIDRGIATGIWPDAPLVDAAREPDPDGPEIEGSTPNLQSASTPLKVADPAGRLPRWKGWWRR